MRSFSMTPQALLAQRIRKDKPKAIHFAEFFWRVVAESANQNELNNENSEYVQEKTIVTLLAYFRFTVYEEVWKWFQS
jgi:hypothetical protein